MHRRTNRAYKTVRRGGDSLQPHFVRQQFQRKRTEILLRKIQTRIDFTSQIRVDSVYRKRNRLKKIVQIVRRTLLARKRRKRQGKRNGAIRKHRQQIISRLRFRKLLVDITALQLGKKSVRAHFGGILKQKCRQKKHVAGEIPAFCAAEQDSARAHRADFRRIRANRTARIKERQRRCCRVLFRKDFRKCPAKKTAPRKKHLGFRPVRRGFYFRAAEFPLARRVFDRFHNARSLFSPRCICAKKKTRVAQMVRKPRLCERIGRKSCIQKNGVIFAICNRFLCFHT